jgi:transcription initiation factor TFIIIB Brf1 subunit/transcription initiation factor TFIIB
VYKFRFLETFAQILTMFDCKFCKLVDSVKNIYGEFICTKCGTVDSIEIVGVCTPSNEYFRNSTNDNCESRQPELYSFTSSKFNKLYAIISKQTDDYKVIKLNKTFCKILDDKLDLDHTFVEMTSSWFKIVFEQKLKETIRQQHAATCFVCCCYCVSMYLKRGYNIIMFCNAFDVDKCTAWTYFPDVVKSFKNKRWYTSLMDSLCTQNKQQLSRNVYLIGSEMGWDNKVQANIVNTGYKILSKTQHYPKIDVCKPTNVYLTCIYIACVIMGISISKSNFCSLVHISMPTLKSIESLVQEALSKMC